MPATILDLPAELRNAIYEMYQADHKRTGLMVLHCQSPQGTYVLPALSRVSYQVRREFLHLWKPTEDIWHARMLKIYIDDLDFKNLLAYFTDQWRRSHRFPHRHFADVQVVFRFTDAGKIAQQAGVVSDWERFNFTWMKGRFRLRRDWSNVDQPQRLPSTATHEVVIDWVSLGVDAQLLPWEKMFIFEPSPKLFEEIVERAKYARSKYPRAPSGQKRAIRSLLRSALAKSRQGLKAG